MTLFIKRSIVRPYGQCVIRESGKQKIPDTPGFFYTFRNAFREVLQLILILAVRAPLPQGLRKYMPGNDGGSRNRAEAMLS
jgi:hypothetical protein